MNLNKLVHETRGKCWHEWLRHHSFYCSTRSSLRRASKYQRETNMKIKATFVEGDKKFHIRTGNGTACGVFLSINIASDKTELPEKSVCKSCLRAGKGAYEEVEEPEHIAAMPEGYRIMEVGETITAGCMYWYDDRWSEASSTIDCEVAGGAYCCCPVVSQKQPETSDNSDRGEQVNTCTTCGKETEHTMLADKDSKWHCAGCYSEQVSDKPVQDPVKMKLHEYECRAKNAEDEEVELRAANDELNEDDANQVALISRIEKERDDYRSQIVEIENKRQRLVFELDVAKSVEAGEQTKRDNYHQAWKKSRESVLSLRGKVAELEALNAAPDPLVNELQVKVVELEESVTRTNAYAELYEEATKGHTLDNIRTIMEAMPPTEELEGKTASIQVDWKDDKCLCCQITFEPEHRAPELVYCLQTTAFDGDNWNGPCGDGHSAARLINGKAQYLGPDEKTYDLIECVRKMVWLGHWNDGLQA